MGLAVIALGIGYARKKGYFETMIQKIKKRRDAYQQKEADDFFKKFLEENPGYKKALEEQMWNWIPTDHALKILGFKFKDEDFDIGEIKSKSDIDSAYRHTSLLLYPDKPFDREKFIDYIQSLAEVDVRRQVAKALPEQKQQIDKIDLKSIKEYTKNLPDDSLKAVRAVFFLLIGKVKDQLYDDYGIPKSKPK